MVTILCPRLIDGNPAIEGLARRTQVGTVVRMQPHHESPAVTETRVVHDSQRRGTALLADAVAEATSPSEALVDLRDHLVAALEHHHVSEDRDLWPLLRAAAPHLGDGLDRLSGEHQRLDAALAELRTADVASPGDPRAVAVARDVRDLVHDHLAHEEPLLFPALRTYVADADWEGFSQRTSASAPRRGIHLLVALLHEVGSDDDVGLILRHLPAEAKQGVPALLDQGRAVLADLRTSAGSVR
jgi:hypothetical protein